MKERIQNFIRVLAAGVVINISLVYSSVVLIFFNNSKVEEFYFQCVEYFKYIVCILAILAFFKITFNIPYAQIVRWGIIAMIVSIFIWLGVLMLYVPMHF